MRAIYVTYIFHVITACNYQLDFGIENSGSVIQRRIWIQTVLDTIVRAGVFLR